MCSFFYFVFARLKHLTANYTTFEVKKKIYIYYNYPIDSDLKNQICVYFITQNASQVSIELFIRKTAGQIDVPTILF